LNDCFAQLVVYCSPAVLTFLGEMPSIAQLFGAMLIYTSIGHTRETHDYLLELRQAYWNPDALSYAVFGDDAHADAATTSVLLKDRRCHLLRQRRSYVDHDDANVPETLNTSRVLQHAAAML